MCGKNRELDFSAYLDSEQLFPHCNLRDYGV